MDVDTGAPLDTLNIEAKKWVKSRGSHAKTVSEIIESKDSVVS